MTLIRLHSLAWGHLCLLFLGSLFLICKARRRLSDDWWSLGRHSWRQRLCRNGLLSRLQSVMQLHIGSDRSLDIRHGLTRHHTLSWLRHLLRWYIAAWSNRLLHWIQLTWRHLLILLRRHHWWLLRDLVQYLVEYLLLLLAFMNCFKFFLLLLNVLLQCKHLQYLTNNFVILLYYSLSWNQFGWVNL